MKPLLELETVKLQKNGMQVVNVLEHQLQSHMNTGLDMALRCPFSCVLLEAHCVSLGVSGVLLRELSESPKSLQNRATST